MQLTDLSQDCFQGGSPRFHLGSRILQRSPLWSRGLQIRSRLRRWRDELPSLRTDLFPPWIHVIFAEHWAHTATSCIRVVSTPYSVYWTLVW